MHAAFDGGDAVREGVDALVVARVPLEGHFDLLVLFTLLEEAHLSKERFLGVVEVAHVIDDAAVVLEGLLSGPPGSLVEETYLEAPIQKGHDLETLEDRLRAELDLFENGGVRAESDRRAGATIGGRTGDFEFSLGLAAVFEDEFVVVAVAIDFEQQFGREGVHDRDPHAVESARDLVAIAAELAAGVEHGEGDFGGGLPLVLGMLINGDAPSVVNDAATSVG